MAKKLPWERTVILKVTLSGAVASYLREAKECGLFGETDEEVAAHLIMSGLRAAVPHLISVRKFGK